MMTVAELVELLSLAPQDLEVAIETSGGVSRRDLQRES